MSCLRVIWICIGFLLLPQRVLALGINEFVPNASVEWIELYNASDSAEYLRQYVIDDDVSFTSDSGSGAKKTLVDLNITNVMYPYVETSSFLNNSGDWVVLFDAQGVLVDKYQYDEDPGGDISLGRSPDGTGTFAILGIATKGSQNAEIRLPTATPAPTPSPTPNPTPTHTPLPTATPTPTMTLTPTMTPKPTSTNMPSPTKQISSDILGEYQVATASPVTSDVPIATSGGGGTGRGQPMVFALLFVGVGLGLLSFAFSLQKVDIWKNLIDQKKD